MLNKNEVKIMEKEIENILNKCDTCNLKECINCEISYTEIRKIKEKMKNTFEYRDIERLKNLCVNKSVQRFEFNDLIALDNLIKDYENLETREQKLIEKLEEDNKRNKKAVIYYKQARRDCKDKSEYKKIYQNNINTLNAKREVRKEILKILKGEKE